jgi:hypothetical protein
MHRHREGASGRSLVLLDPGLSLRKPMMCNCTSEDDGDQGATKPTRRGKSLLIFRNRVKPWKQNYSAFVLTQITGITPPVSPD